MGTRTRRTVLYLHITSSVGWVGAVLAFLPLAAVAVTGTDDLVVRAAYIAMAPISRLVILPCALVSLATGLASALGTPWGLLRHYWVVVKLVLTVVCIAILALQLGPIDALADRASDPDAIVVHLPEAPRPLVHAVGGLFVLLIIQALGVFKPRGLTRFGHTAIRDRV